MARKHDEDELLRSAVDAALDGGLGELTFGRLAARIGIADRTLVYYFADKPTLIQAVLGELAGRLFAELAAAFGDERRRPAELLTMAYPVLTTGEADRIFAVWFEFAGQAAVGHEPQRTAAGAMLDAWIEWLVDRIDVRPRSRARSEAAALIATLDGALLMHHIGRPADAAAAIARAAR